MYDLNEIYQQMKSHGLMPDGLLIPDEKIHRFRLDETDSKNSGWYTGFRNTNNSGIDWYVFLCGNHRTGEVFKAQSGIKLDKQDRARAEEQIRKAQRRHVLEKEELQKAAAKKAKEKWETFSEQFGKNAYLEKKGFEELYGARLDGFNLCVPMRDITGELRNIETITSDGKKKGLYGGQRTGLFHTIGDLEKGEVIYATEGFSTGVSVYDSMFRAPVVVAFNSGNLVSVCETISKKYPEKKIVICGDNDQYPNEKGEINNVGKIKAEEAANICGGKFVIPEFRETDEKPTDFYDLFSSCGPEIVRKQIEAIKPQLPVETFDRNYVVHHPYPDENEKNFSRKGTLENVQELLRRLRITVRYNVISKKEEILIPGSSFTMDNESNATLAHIIDWCERVGIPTGNLKSYITAIADRNLYNPVATWIESVPWDGQSRLKDLFDTIHSPDHTGLKETLMRKWLISAVAAIYEPDGVSAHGVLVLQGKQYSGKTQWFKRLVSSHLEVTADGMILDPDNKDSVLACISKWLIELGELDATFTKADIARLKAFVTKDRDIIRRPFAPMDSHYARRTVFFASVNEKEFLNDPTGNRRFWTIPCESIDYNHQINTQQLWAEVRELYLRGESWTLDKVEVENLNSHNEHFETVSPIEERIRDYYAWTEQPENVRYVFQNSTAVCISIGIHNPSVKDAREASRAIQKISNQKPNRHRKFNMPLRKDA